MYVHAILGKLHRRGTRTSSTQQSYQISNQVLQSIIFRRNQVSHLRAFQSLRLGGSLNIIVTIIDVTLKYLLQAVCLALDDWTRRMMCHLNTGSTLSTQKGSYGVDPVPSEL